MKKMEFDVIEKVQGSLISYVAKLQGVDEEIQLQQSNPGSYPEITTYLKKLGLDVSLVYDASLGDTLQGQRWSYNRNVCVVVVNDMPRTIFRIG
ncbi:MAG: hypothetical protein WCD42_10560 [Rhizomicrobium sp.]